MPHSIASCCLEDEREELIPAKPTHLRRNLVALERIENQRLKRREPRGRLSILGNPEHMSATL